MYVESITHHFCLYFFSVCRKWKVAETAATPARGGVKAIRVTT